jgi:hypothetical protein
MYSRTSPVVLENDSAVPLGPPELARLFVMTMSSAVIESIRAAVRQSPRHQRFASKSKRNVSVHGVAGFPVSFCSVPLQFRSNWFAAYAEPTKERSTAVAMQVRTFLISLPVVCRLMLGKAQPLLRLVASLGKVRSRCCQTFARRGKASREEGLGHSAKTIRWLPPLRAEEGASIRCRSC